jgi:kynureninase
MADILNLWLEAALAPILYICKKSRILDTYERFHIYEVRKQNIQLNDYFTEIFNPIYDVVPWTEFTNIIYH